MNAQDLHRLLDYHYWARDRMLDAAERLPPDDFTRDLGSSFKSVRDTLVHTYSAEWIWCSRWRGTSPPAMVPAESFGDVASLRAAWRDLETTVRSVLDGFERSGVGSVVAYRDMKGKEWESVFWEMVQHVVNHASYHRGQVATMLRQLHASPAGSMDMIVFDRERRERDASGRA